MNFQTALGEVVKDQRLAQEKTLRDVCDKSYLALGFLSEVERGVKMPSSDTIDAIANGLGVNAYDLIIETGYRMAEKSQEIPETPESLFVRGDSWIAQYADLK
jgi:transcriptional regulator with XRE-family HTH domain